MQRRAHCRLERANERRRAILAAGMALAFVGAPRAEPGDRVRRIGYLSGGAGPEVIAKPLADLGWIDGQNVRIETRIVPGDSPSLPAIAGELAASGVDVIVAFSTNRIAALAKATHSIPIVGGLVPDPLGAGFAETLRRPGRNITGVSLGLPELASFQIGLLRTVRPGLKRIVAMVPSVSGARIALRSVVAAATAAGVAWDFVAPESLAEVERTLARLPGPSAAVYLASLPEGVEWPQATPATLRYRIATLVSDEAWVREGALMYYAVDHADPFRRVAALVDKILRGANPAELPFELPDRTTFVFNRTTAKAIGANVPAELLLRVTEMVG